jgi:hypothetical protein
VVSLWDPRGVTLVFWVYPCTNFHGHDSPIQPN